MISVLRDENNRIVAVCEWLPFEDGRLAENGELVYIGEFEVNPGVERAFERLVGQVIKQNPQFKRVIWYREYKYPNRGYRIYNREQILRRKRWGEEIS